MSTVPKLHLSSLYAICQYVYMNPVAAPGNILTNADICVRILSDPFGLGFLDGLAVGRSQVEVIPARRR